MISSGRVTAATNLRNLFECCHRKAAEAYQIEALFALPINQLERWHQAAVAGGRLRRRRPSCSARSSSLGYLMRVCSMFCRVNRKVSAMIFNSFKVRSHSSNCPSAIRRPMISLTSCSIFWGVGFSRLREALSTASARLMIPLSLILRLWSAVSEALFAYFRDILLPNVHDFSAFPGITLLLNGSLVKVSDQ